MLIRKKVIDAVGLFDDDFFVYFEETDFCTRVWISGYRIVYTPSATIYHRGGFSARKFGAPGIIFHSFKNRICSYIKNLEFATLFRLLFLHILLCQTVSLIYLCLGHVKLFIAVQKAFLWNVSRLGETLSKRRYVQQRLRKKPDHVFTNLGNIHPRLSYYFYLLRGVQYYED